MPQPPLRPLLQDRRTDAPPNGPVATLEAASRSVRRTQQDAIALVTNNAKLRQSATAFAPVVAAATAVVAVAAAVQVETEEAELRAKIEVKRQKYSIFFSQAQIYLAIDNQQDRLYVDRELDLRFAVRPLQFLNHRITCIIYDPTGRAGGHLDRTCAGWSVVWLSVVQFKSAMLKYFNPAAVFAGTLAAQRRQLQMQQLQHQQQNGSAANGLVSKNAAVFVEFKFPFLMLSDMTGTYRPVHKEYVDLIKITLAATAKDVLKDAAGKNGKNDENAAHNGNAGAGNAVKPPLKQSASDKPAAGQTLPILQLPFFGLSYQVNAQAGGSPFHHIYDQLPFPKINSSKQSLLQTMNAGNNSANTSATANKQLQSRNYYLPLIQPPAPWMGIDQQPQQQASGPALRRLQRKTTARPSEDEEKARLALILNHTEKKKQAAEYFKKRKASNMYPLYRYAHVKGETKAPPGYCECCLKKYDDLAKHLAEPEHRHFAMNEMNYKDLDEVISKSNRRLNRDLHEDLVETNTEIYDCTTCNGAFVVKFSVIMGESIKGSLRYLERDLELQHFFLRCRAFSNGFDDDFGESPSSAYEREYGSSNHSSDESCHSSDEITEADDDSEVEDCSESEVSSETEQHAIAALKILTKMAVDVCANRLSATSSSSSEDELTPTIANEGLIEIISVDEGAVHHHDENDENIRTMHACELESGSGDIAEKEVKRTPYGHEYPLNQLKETRDSQMKTPKNTVIPKNRSPVSMFKRFRRNDSMLSRFSDVVSGGDEDLSDPDSTESSDDLTDATYTSENENVDRNRRDGYSGSSSVSSGDEGEYHDLRPTTRSSSKHSQAHSFGLTSAGKRKRS